jgi:host factor-I protein
MAARLLKAKRKNSPSAKEAEKKGTAGGRTLSAQDRFLTQMMEEHRKVAVFLSSGIKLEGEIVSYDQYVILMKGAMTDKVYKHAVSTIQPLDHEPPKLRARPRGEGQHTPTIIRRTRSRLIKREE